MSFSKKVKSIAIAISMMLLITVPQSANAVARGYESKWGNFTTKVYSGSGDDFVDLPKARRYGIIQVSHDGDSNFIVHSLDAGGDVIDYLVNEIGSVEATVTFGFGYFDPKTKSFEIQADGDWEIRVREVNKAPAYHRTGSGTTVMKYSAGQKRFRIRHSGESNFIIWQHCTNGESELIVNVIGSYNGRKYLRSGKCVLEIKAEGPWSFTR